MYDRAPAHDAEPTARGQTAATVKPSGGEMTTPMKTPKPELQNTRILRLANRVVMLPFVFAVACYGWLSRRFKSKAQLRAGDQLRQSRVRRELRGLPPDHVAPAARR
jgi:hypothetical protein